MTTIDIRLPQHPTEFAALIDGEAIWAASRATIERNNPAHNVPVSRYPQATPADVSRAIAAARRAAESRIWSGKSGAERARIILAVARLIEDTIEELRRVECLETGKPAANIEREIRGSVAHWEYAATLARHCYGDTYDSLGGNALGLVLREPIGVVGIITPWNYPLLIVSQKLPFALAVGCCTVVKPSEMASGTTLVLGRLLREAGVPLGVVNIVAGYGHDVGQAICDSKLVDMISFTGSTKIGKQIARSAADTLKKVSLELGGKSAHIVCADADLEAAAEKVVMGATRNAGQACVSGSRLLVERSIAKNFVAATIEKMRVLAVGDPLDLRTQMGPLISQAQKERVAGYVKEGQRVGATMWARDATAEKNLPGFFAQPTVFTNVTPDMKIAQEEIFGPVLSVIEFDTVTEAIAIANGTAYGLAAGVWTRDLDKAFQFSRALKAGTIEINTFMAGAPELPLTGHRESGLGHERGRFAVEEFTELKTINLQLAAAR
jgi:acyl-CoA reductase-like NAD-dependent aldehyde dehydrogenase